MKKKIILSLLVVVTVFTLIGCGKSGNSENKEESNDKISTSVKVEDLKVELDMKGSFNGITYKYPSSALTSNVGTYSIMDYMDGQDFVFRVAMYYFSGKTIEQVMQNTTLSSLDAIQFNSETWNVYEGVQTDGKKIINYVTEHNGDAYTITFISDKTIDELATVFMKNVSFK